MQGIETREVIKDVNKEQVKAGLKPGNVPQAAIMSPQPANLSKVGGDARMIADALDMAADYANERTKEQTEADYLSGQLMRHQGKAYKDALDAGGYIGEGWQMADVQITATDMLNEQRGLIKGQHYASSPDAYREYLTKYSTQIDQFAQTYADSSPVAHKAIQKTKLAMLETLAEEQSTAHIAWNYEKTVDSIPKLIENALASGDPDALEQAKEYMKPGAFNVAPKDAQAAIDKYLDNKGDLVQTRDEFNVWHALQSEQYKHTQGIAPSAPTGLAGAPMQLPVRTGKAVNMDLPEQTDEGADASDATEGAQAGFSALVQRMTGSASAGLQSKAAKILQRVERSEAVQTAVATGDFSDLSSKEEATAFDQTAQKVQATLSKSIPMGTPEFDAAFYPMYAKELAKTSAVNKSFAGTMKAKLVLAKNAGDKTSANWAAKRLKELNDAGGESLVGRYLDNETEAMGFRVLGYVHGGADYEDAVMRSIEVENSKDLPKFSSEKVNKIVNGVLKEHELSFWEEVQSVFYRDFASTERDNYLPTKDELLAPSEGKANYEAAIAALAERYMPDTRDSTGATLRAVSALQPRTAVLGGTPILRPDRISWTDAINESDRSKPIPDNILERDRTLLNAVVMDRLKARSAVFGPSNTFLGRLMNLKEFSTYLGSNNDFDTWQRGVPDYRNLHIAPAPDGDGVYIRLKKERNDPTDDSWFFPDTFTELSTEYVHVSNNDMRLGIRDRLGIQ